jgi:hypothetical protein
MPVRVTILSRCRACPQPCRPRNRPSACRCQWVRDAPRRASRPCRTAARGLVTRHRAVTTPRSDSRQRTPSHCQDSSRHRDSDSHPGPRLVRVIRSRCVPAHGDAASRSAGVCVCAAFYLFLPSTYPCLYTAIPALCAHVFVRVRPGLPSPPCPPWARDGARPTARLNRQAARRPGPEPRPVPKRWRPAQAAGCWHDSDQ